MRKILLLIGLCAVGLDTAADIWADPSTGLTWAYTISESVATIGPGSWNTTAISRETEGVIEVPSMLGNCPVMHIGDSAFNGCAKLTSVIIPDGVESIGESAFVGCRSLISITFPNKLKMIGGGCFSGCSSLLAVDFPDGLTRISPSSFADCTALRTIRFPGSLRVVDSAAFYGCISLSEMALPEGVEVLEKGCFTECAKLKNVIIPVTVTNDLYGAFSWCSGLTNVVVQGGVTTLESPFYGCSSLQSIWIAGSVRKLSVDCFGKCSALKRVYFGGNAPAVSAGIFKNASSDCTVYVDMSSTGWGVSIPGTWYGVAIKYDINGSVLTWLEDLARKHGDDYKSKFHERFGNDYLSAWNSLTGKQDNFGNGLTLAADYIAGTDPINPNDIFTASIGIVDGKVTVSYAPELDDTRKAHRKYTNFGKKNLKDEKWTEIPFGHESEYNFFKVTVEMK